MTLEMVFHETTIPHLSLKKILEESEQNLMYVNSVKVLQQITFLKIKAFPTKFYSVV